MKKLISLFWVLCTVCLNVEGTEQPTQVDGALSLPDLRIALSEGCRRVGSCDEDHYRDVESRLTAFGLGHVDRMRNAAFLIAQNMGISAPDHVALLTRQTLIVWFVEHAPGFESLIAPASVWMDPTVCADPDAFEREMTLISFLSAEKEYMDELRLYEENVGQQIIDQLHSIDPLLNECVLPDGIAYAPGFGVYEGEIMTLVLRSLRYKSQYAHEILAGHPDEMVDTLREFCEAAYQAQSNEFQGECPLIIDGASELIDFVKRSVFEGSFSQVQCIEFRNLKLTRLEFRPIGCLLLELLGALQTLPTLVAVRFGEGCEIDQVFGETFFEPHTDGWCIIKRDYDPNEEQLNLRFLHWWIENMYSIDTYVQQGGDGMDDLLNERIAERINFEMDESRLHPSFGLITED